MKKLSTLGGLAIVIGCSSSFAGTMGPVQPVLSPWYLVGSAGYSNSKDADIRVDSRIWDNARQGYTDSLNSTAALTFGVGTYICNAFHIDLRGERRGDYSYSKFQTGTNTGTSGFTGNTRVRRFKLKSDSLMLSGWLDIGELYNNLLWQVSSFAIQPFVGAGIGANYMDVHNFYTVGESFGNIGRYEIASINASRTGTRFAWHGAAGLSAQITQRATFSIGYNYFDGGHPAFPFYIDSSTSAPEASLGRNGVTVTPWRAKLRANEAFAELRVRI